MLSNPPNTKTPSQTTCSDGEDGGLPRDHTLTMRKHDIRIFKRVVIQIEQLIHPYNKCVLLCYCSYESHA